MGLLVGLVGSPGCQTGDSSVHPFNEAVLSDYQERHKSLTAVAETVADFPKIENRRPAMRVGTLTTTQPSVAQFLEWQMPDPSVAAEIFEQRAKHITDERRLRDYRRVSAKAVEHLKDVKRPTQIRLSLAEVIHRTVANNYLIRVAGYEPAITAAQIVEAEAQFDATFYANWLDVIQDQPVASALQGSSTKVRQLGAGIRKLLSTGTMVDIGYNLQRTESTMPFQTLNPSYTNNFAVQLTQPLLRNFGEDFVRSGILIARNKRDVAIAKFRTEVRKTIEKVEKAYWQLVAARRSLTIAAELLAETEETYRYIEARRDFDAFAVLIANSKSAVDLARVELIKAVAQVKEAEDGLKVLLNDPDLPMPKDIEIIPVDIPDAMPITLDALGEMQTALEHRSELKEAELKIEEAALLVGTAKNQTLPKFDAVFVYKVLGLENDPDGAFDQLTENDFHEYQVGVQFEWPIGNRAARAKLRQAKLSYQAAIEAKRGVIEQVLWEVNSALRGIRWHHQAIYPAVDATIAAEENVRATKERAERKSPPELQTELNGQQQLAQARARLLEEVVSYNVAITDLENAKGTLLLYNNVIVSEPE